MIRNEDEYKEAVKRLEEEKRRLAQHRAALEQEGFSGEELKRLLDPLASFHLQLKEEVQSYEGLRRGELKELTNLRGLGHALICLRIANGVSQQGLADKLNVHPSQISRDERNEYHGITLERAAKILEALGVKIRVKFAIEDDELVVA